MERRMVDDGMGGWGKGRDSNGMKGQRVQADGRVLIAFDLHGCIRAERAEDITHSVIGPLV